MSLHFAYGRTTLSSSDWSITVNTGDGNLTGDTKYFSLQAQNPIGKNLQLISAPITFATGDSITFMINESALTEAEGWTHYVIGVSDTNTANSFNQIARINIYDMSSGAVDFDTPEVFPLTLTIEEDAQLVTAEYVDEKVDLPTTNIIYGMRRGVTENNYIYEYNPFSTLTANNDDVIAADVGVWLKKEEFTNYVEDITAYNGCAFDILNLGDFSQVELPTYNADGTDSLRVKYYLINNTGFTLQPGTGLTVSAQIGGIERTELFDGKLFYRINGVVTPTDGTLRTTSTITGQTLDFINTDYVYTKANPVTISKDYISNQTGLYVDVYVNFLNLEFNNLLPDGYLQLFLSYISPKGVFTPVGTLFEKGIIYNKYNKRRVLPDTGLNVVVGEGEGITKNFTWYSCNTTVSGLTANTANQKLYLNINGVVFPDVSERTSSVLRAIVDTTVKESKVSSWTSYAAVALNAGLTVTVDYECDTDLNQQVRSTYPDVIANDWAIFNPTLINIYVQRQSDGETRKFTGFLPAGNNVSQDFIITDWSAGTVVGSVPSVSASFFDPSTNSFAQVAAAGNFSAGNYRVAHTYVWNGDTVSDISHSVASGCISESQVNGEQVFGVTSYNTIAQIKNETDVYDGFKLYCKNTQRLYVYDESSSDDADDYDVLQPVGGVGRWVSTAKSTSRSFAYETSPTVTDDADLGYRVTDKWLDVVAEKEYTLIDSTIGAAVWKEVGISSYNDLTDTPTLGTASTLNVNVADGVCGLDSSGKVSATYLPSYVDDVLEYANLAGFPVTGEANKIYIALDTNRTYRWGGSVYVEISNPFSGSYDDLTDKPTLGTAAALDVGTNANNVVQLDGTGKLPAVDGSQLTNLPPGGGTSFADNVFRIQDNTDNTKQIAFEASGITTGTTRTLTVPDVSGTLISTDALTDKSLYYYDASSKLLKPISIGTVDQVLVAKPSLDPPYQFATVVGSGGRGLLSADRTYYVRTDGNDSNDGLTDSNGGAFLTIQKAINVCSGLDLNNFNLNIKIADGNYLGQGTIQLKAPIGGGTFKIEGNLTNNNNVSIKSIQVTALNPLCKIILDGITLDNNTNNNTDFKASCCLHLESSTIYLGKVAFKGYLFLCWMISGAKLNTESAVLTQLNNATSSGISAFFLVQGQSTLNIPNSSIVFSGSPANSLGIFYAESLSFINLNAATLSGSKTGTEYIVATGSNATIRQPNGAYLSS